MKQLSGDVEHDLDVIVDDLFISIVKDFLTGLYNTGWNIDHIVWIFTNDDRTILRMRSYMSPNNVIYDEEDLYSEIHIASLWRLWCTKYQLKLKLNNDQEIEQVLSI